MVHRIILLFLILLTNNHLQLAIEGVYFGTEANLGSKALSYIVSYQIIIMKTSAIFILTLVVLVVEIISNSL